MAGAVTFDVADRETEAIRTLVDLGFAVETTGPFACTVLDTFDGALHRAGLRLLLRETDQLELELSGADVTTAHLAVGAPPRFPTDLPSGPFRERLAALTGVRALLPRLRLHTERTVAARRDEHGKAVTIAEVHTDVRVGDHHDPSPVRSTATLEVREVPGSAKATRRVVRSLRAEGLRRLDVDTIEAAADAAGVDLAGFTARATVPLDPAMSSGDGFRLVLANLANAISANWQGTIDQLDPEFLHELRIGVRRTRTVLTAANGVMPSELRDLARAEFAWIATLTSTPRDLDVYLLEWSSYTDPLDPAVAAALDPVRDLLERRRSEVHDALADGLGSQRAVEFMTTWHEQLARPFDPGDARRADRPLGRVAAKRIARAHDVLVERGRAIDPDTPAARVHELRKDAKKLRYLIECFGSLLPATARKQSVSRLKRLQDNLGEHQDAAVHVEELREVASALHESGASVDTMLAIGQLVEQLDQRRAAAREEFAERFAGYDTPATQRALDAMLTGIDGTDR